MELGSVNEVSDDDRPTEVPVPTAALFRVTVQLACALPIRVVGVHWNEEITGGTTKDTEAVCEVPLSDAVRCAV